jgi:hypothetical protein
MNPAGMNAAGMNAAGMNIDDLPAVGLAETVLLADLQTRTDRKYLVSPAVVSQLVDEVNLSALEIGGTRRFRYQSIYFDTPDLASFHGAALGRRKRFKVRTRGYLDANEVVLEVKRRGRRGQTVKDRLPVTEQGILLADGLVFIEPLVGRLQLEATVETTYTRTTLVDLEAPFRVAVDTAVSARDLSSGAQVSVGNLLVVETKSAGPPTTVDRWMWAHGHRPVRFSKYCTSLAALRPELPSNRWHRAIDRYMADYQAA